MNRKKPRRKTCKAGGGPRPGTWGVVHQTRVNFSVQGSSDRYEMSIESPWASRIWPSSGSGLWGAISAIDVTALGHAVVALGGGRVRAGEAIDPRVGLSMLAKLGEQVGPGRPLALVHAADDTAAEVAIAAVSAAYRLGEDGVPGPLVRDRIAP